MGIENYGSSYFSFLGGETLTLYGANNNEAYLRAGSNDSLSSTAIITPNLSATIISATTYLNLPSGTATWNANQLQGINVSSTAPSVGQALVYDGNGWEPSTLPVGGGGATPFGSNYQFQFYNNGALSSVSGFTWDPNLFGGRLVVSSPIAGLNVYGNIYGNAVESGDKFTLYGLGTSQDIKMSPASSLSASKFEIQNLSATTLSAATYLNLPVSSHNQLTNLDANDHPQYVLSSTNNTLSSLVSNIQTSSNNLSGVVGSHIASSDVHFTSGSLSGYYAASSWVNSNYSPTSHNHSFSALSGLSDTQITSPALSSVLKWNGSIWVAAPDATGTGGAGSPGGPNTSVQFNNNGSFSGTSDFNYTASSQTLIVPTISATTYQNLPKDWTLVLKTANQTTISNTTLVDDTALNFTMEANATYAIRLEVYFNTNATADFKYGFRGTQAAADVHIRRDAIVGGGTGYSTIAISTAYNTAGTSLAGTGTDGYISLSGFIENGASPSTFYFTWAQNTSNATDSTVFKGSYLEYCKV